MSDLNLLPSSAKFQAERMRLKTIVNSFLWVFGGIWLLLVISGFLFDFVLNFNLKKLNTEYKTVSSQYKSLSENMVLNQKIKYQAKIVAKVLSDRFEYGESMKLVSSLFSDKIIIDNLDITDKKKFEISGSVVEGENMNEVEKLVEQINSGLVDGVKSAEIKNVSVDTIKGWNFTMEVELL
jgi:hypothetical protein